MAQSLSQSMTPRSGRTPQPSRRGIPMLSLNASYVTTSPLADEGLCSATASPAIGNRAKGLEEETLPTEETEENTAAAEEAEAQLEEQRQLIESQGTRIEELTRQIQASTESFESGRILF